VPTTLGTVPGVQDGIPLFRNAAWHTYNWANYGPVYAGGAFTAVSTSAQTGTTAQINFTPQFAGRARVEYSAGGKGDRILSAVVACSAGTPTSIPLYNLQPSTQYVFLLVQYATLTDQTGQTLVQTGYSDQYSFATTGAGQAAPIISQVQVVLSGGAGNRTATITWMTDVPCLNEVNYGATVSYGSAKNDTTTPPGQRGATVSIGKLTPGNTYHYQCWSQGRDYAHGAIATTADNTFVA
jgi:hypothetical protein